MIYPTPLDRRCEIHATKMNGEGWYTTANVLAHAADRIRALETRLADAENRLRSAEEREPNAAAPEEA